MCLIRYVLLAALVVTTAEAQDRRFVSSPFYWFDLAEHLSADVQLGDLDGDGDLDAILANGRHWAEPDFAFFNAGDGKLPEARPLGSALRSSYTIRLADLDGDGDLDAVVVHDYLTPQVLLGDGGGHFTPGAPVEPAADAPGAPSSPTSTGTAGSAPPHSSETTRGASTSVAAADFDGDGDVDLTFARRDGQPSVIAFNDGAGGFTERELPSSVDDTRCVVAGDFDGDGDSDIALGVVGSANVIYSGDGLGRFVRSGSFGNADGRTYALAAADLDLDGDLDLVAGNDEQPNAAYFNTGAGVTFERVQLGDEAAETYGVSVGDMDGDGYPDVVFANSGGVNEVSLNRPSEL